MKITEERLIQLESQIAQQSQNFHPGETVYITRIPGSLYVLPQGIEGTIVSAVADSASFMVKINDRTILPLLEVTSHTIEVACSLLRSFNAETEYLSARLERLTETNTRRKSLGLAPMTPDTLIYNPV